jgi:hypothetical protein
LFYRIKRHGAAREKVEENIRQAELGGAKGFVHRDVVCLGGCRCGWPRRQGCGLFNGGQWTAFI